MGTKIDKCRVFFLRQLRIKVRLVAMSIRINNNISNDRTQYTFYRREIPLKTTITQKVKIKKFETSQLFILVFLILLTVYACFFDWVYSVSSPVANIQMFKSKEIIQNSDISENDGGWSETPLPGKIPIGETCDGEGSGDGKNPCNTGLYCNKLDTKILFGETWLDAKTFYCLPPAQLGAACTAERGGQWVITYNPVTSAYNLVCRCTRPDVFISSEIDGGDCNNVTACKNPIAGTETSISALLCECDYFQTFEPYSDAKGRGPTCLNSDFFTSPHDPIQFDKSPVLDRDLVNSEYLVQFPEGRSFPDPCAVDYMQGDLILNVAKAVRDERTNIVQCKLIDPVNSEGQYALVIASTDYLDQNNGSAANALVKVAYSNGAFIQLGFEIDTPSANSLSRRKREDESKPEPESEAKTSFPPIVFHQIPLLNVFERLYKLLPLGTRYPFMNTSPKYLRLFLPFTSATKDTNALVCNMRTAERIPQILLTHGHYGGTLLPVIKHVYGCAFVGWSMITGKISDLYQWNTIVCSECVFYIANADDTDPLHMYGTWLEIDNTYKEWVSCNHINSVQVIKEHMYIFSKVFGYQLLFTLPAEPSASTTHPRQVHVHNDYPGFTATFMYNHEKNMLFPAYNDVFLDSRAADVKRKKKLPEVTKDNVSGFLIPSPKDSHVERIKVFDGESLGYCPVDEKLQFNWSRYMNGPFNNYTSSVGDEKMTLQFQPFFCPYEPPNNNPNAR